MPKTFAKTLQISLWFAGLCWWLAPDVLHADYNAVPPEPHRAGSHALAAPQRADPEQVPLATSTTHARSPERTSDYTGWLLSSYVAAPVLGLGLPLWVSQASLSDEGAWAVGLSGLTIAVGLPVLTHFLHTETWRGWRVLLALPALTFAGTFIGAWVGSRITARPASEGDGSSGMAGMVYGGAIGGVVACLGWAAYDAIETASLRGDRRAAANSGTRFAVLPQPGGASVAMLGRF